MEKLREIPSYFARDDHPYLYCSSPEKILNGLLGEIFVVISPLLAKGDISVKETIRAPALFHSYLCWTPRGQNGYYYELSNDSKNKNCFHKAAIPRKGTAALFYSTKICRTSHIRTIYMAFTLLH